MQCHYILEEITFTFPNFMNNALKEVQMCPSDWAGFANWWTGLFKWLEPLRVKYVKTCWS